LLQPVSVFIHPRWPVAGRSVIFAKNKHNHIKKILIISLVVVSGAGFLQSCKKGENDPFLSLRTRRARITGEWTMTGMTSTTVQTLGSSSSTTSRTYSDGTETSTYTYTGGSMTTTDHYTIVNTFRKDGTYTEVYTTDSDVTTIEGTWMFLNKSKEDKLKNKEAILLTNTKTTSSGGTTTVNDLSGQVFVIDELRNKKMVWTTEYGQSDGGGSETNSYKMTFKQN
jgi:hypothetical protein